MAINEKATEGDGPTVASKTYCERYNNCICAFFKIIIIWLYNRGLIAFKTTERLFKRFGLGGA